MKLTRVRCRCLEDNVEGWVSKEGSQGTPFLKDAAKPYLSVAAESAIDKSREPKADEAAAESPTAKVGEVLEGLEGPIKGGASFAQRVKAKATKDGKEGWVTMTDRFGQTSLKEDKSLWKVVNAIVLTDDLDVKASKVVRRLDVDEELQGLSEKMDDKPSGMKRVQVKAKR